MTKRTLWLSLGLAGLGITLAALPGPSAKPQDPYPTTLTQLQAKVNKLVARAQQASDTLGKQQEALDRVQEIENEQEPDDQNVEVFVGDGGSWLGVETREVTPKTVTQFKLPAERGALVHKVIPGSPASKAGLKENDVITEVNGQRVEGTAQFRRMIREIPSGRSVLLTILREGKTQSVGATLGKTESRHLTEVMRGTAPGGFAFQIPEVPEIGDLEGLNGFGTFGLGQPRLGIDAEDLHGELGNYFGAPDGEGVLVRSVFPDSPAAKAGMKAGDVITFVDGKRIRSVADLRETMRESKEDGKSIKVSLLRNKTEQTLTVELPARPKPQIQQRSERINL